MIQQLALERQALEAMGTVVEAQGKLLVIQARRVATANAWADEMSEDVRKTELISDAMGDRIHQMADTFGVGTHGNAFDQLNRIEHMWNATQRAFEEMAGKQAELLADAANAKMASATAEVG